MSLAPCLGALPMVVWVWVPSSVAQESVCLRWLKVILGVMPESLQLIVLGNFHVYAKGAPKEFK